MIKVCVGAFWRCPVNSVPMHHTWGPSRNQDGDKGVVGTNGRKELPSSELVARPARWSPVSWIPWSSRSRTLWPNLTHASALGMPLLVTSLLVTFGRPRIYSQQLCDSRWTEFRPGVGKILNKIFQESSLMTTLHIVTICIFNTSYVHIWNFQ